MAEATKPVTADVDMTALWRQIAIPTLCLHGEDSTLLTTKTCELMATEGPKATIIHYPKTGHLPPLLGQDIADLEAWILKTKPTAATATATATATAAAKK